MEQFSNSWGPRRLLLAGVLCFWAMLGQAGEPIRLDPVSAENEGRWPVEKAWQWYANQPWLVGCNFVTSTAVNDVEMWQAETFDPATIERELGWAQALGFNTVRVFVNYAVWEADAAGLKERMGRFLELADQHGIRTMFILFDDCFKPEPKVGRQTDPEPGVHNSQWVQSPGLTRRDDKGAWPKLEAYVRDLVGTFARDQRVLMWDLYNEPSQSPPLVEATFRWARAAKPSQPLTSCWLGVEFSDILSFHSYGELKALREEIDKLQPNRRGRPYVCTEWMARTAGSRFETHLPYFKEQKIGCWNWGLVAGRTQTFFPWGSPPGAPEPSLWFHDILRRDGTPFDAEEVRSIRLLTGTLARPKWRVIVPTADGAPVPWRYTLESPADGWFQKGFDDASWPIGPAPFGQEEPPVARKPNTRWTTGEIWLRRECDLPDEPMDQYALRIHHDEDAEVYVNGVLAAKLAGYNAAYADLPISAEARAALKPGKNLLAVHCRQTGGGQYLDLGLVGRPAPLPLRKLFDTPLRDPSICRGPDGWYLTGTVEPFWGSNEGICVWRSPDLVHWTSLGKVWKYGASAWHEPFLKARKPLWAPEIHYLKGTFWLTYSMPGYDGTAKTSGSGLLKSTTGKAEGPYLDMQPGERMGDEIDASLFEDDDGTVYFLWHCGKIARLKPDMSGLAEPYRWLKTTGTDANPRHHSGLCAGIFGADSFDHVGYEGMFVFKANGRYHLCCSEGFDGRYSCTIATADELSGPYGARYEAIPHAGHNTFFQDDSGQWWSTYFGSDDGAPWQERPAIFPVEFDAAGRARASEALRAPVTKPTPPVNR